MGTTYKPVYVVSDGSKVSSQWIELSDWSLAQITGGNSVTFTGEGTLTIKIHMYINGKEYVPSVTVNIKKKTVEPPPSIKYGDVDLDGKISAYDAALTLAEYAAGSAQKPSELKENQRLAAMLQHVEQSFLDRRDEVETVQNDSVSCHTRCDFA